MTPLIQSLRALATRQVPRAVRKRMRAGVDTLLARDRPGRALEVHDDDSFIVSYPKSGNTWVRFLVANLIHAEPTDFESMETRVPTIYKHTSRELAGFDRPRVLKSHEYFDPRYPRVVYVVRDPRDVIVSYYHYSLRKGFIGEGHSLEEFGREFVHGRSNKFGTWQENVASWLAARADSPAFLLVRYEDLRSKCAHELSRIARLLGRTTDDATIARAVEASSFERMRALEAKSGGATLHLKHKRADVPFVRKGTVGGWKQELPDSVRASIEGTWAPLMKRLGYL
ncbi:MAG: sulfotransferase domain-containing protein [Deltaproteobacteria bacterium]|nr:sulfotransferase domain-containing protein [Deltaproteobacteria bacterium]